MTVLPLSINPEEVYAEAVARAQLVAPSFVPRGVLEQMLRMFAGMAAEINGNLAVRLPAEVREMQGDLLGIPVQDGVPASSTITVTAIDTVGYTLPEGSRVWIGGSTGSAIEAATTVALTIPGGSSSGVVAIQCVDVGAGNNGASGVVQIDPLDWISSATPVALVAPLSGGVDAEKIDEYAVRLPEETQLLAVAVSLPADAATLCRRNPAVGWAYAVDKYDSTSNISNLPLTFSVVVATPAGLAVSGPVLTELDAQLQALREANYVIRVTNATYTPVSVTAQVVPMPGWAAATVIANASAALTSAVSPATHLSPPFSLTPNYRPPTRIYTTDLIAACKAADGVLHVIPSTFDIVGVGDYLELASPVHLPTPGTITVTAA